MRLPDRLYVGVSATMTDEVPDVPHVELGADTPDLPDPRQTLERFGRERTSTLLAWHVITHRRSDPRYKKMSEPPPEHAAVGHFDRSRWTDEAWERTDRVARALDAHGAVLQTPASFKASAEHALRLENFIAHAQRPGMVLMWEWAQGSWPEKKARELCDRIGAVPVLDPLKAGVPDAELIYLRFRNSPRGGARDDDLKKIALATRDRIGWVIFSTKTAVEDAQRFLQMV